MKLYKICLQCLHDLQGIQSRKAIVQRNHCEQKPRCFDQPERSKREDTVEIQSGRVDELDFSNIGLPF